MIFQYWLSDGDRFSPNLSNRIAETTTTTGTGSYLLAGVVLAGYRPFADAGNGGLVPYCVTNAANTISEWGLGTYDSSANTLARTTILGNYLGTTAAINWAAGTKNIFSPSLTEFQDWITYNNSLNVEGITLAESGGMGTPASGFGTCYVLTDGKLYFRNDAGTEYDLTDTGAVSNLDSLTDVVITSVASNNVLQYNGSEWVNRTLAAAGIQPLDATLTALAALTIAANSLTIGTAADTFSQTTFAVNTFPARASTGSLEAKTVTDFMLTVLDDSDAATARATLGVGTGTGDALVANPLSQFAATNSAQLRGVLSDETGTGVAVFGTAPTLTAPVIGDFTSATHTHQTAATGGVIDTLPEDFSLTGDISPPQITADQNDYTPANLATSSTLRLTTDATRNITGLAGGADGRILLLHNVGSFNVVLVDSSASSSAANRFAISADITIAPDQSVLLQYDSTSSRWRAVSYQPTGLLTDGDKGNITVSASGTTWTIDAGAVAYTMLAAMTSANFAGVISDETGSGLLVFGTSPTITTPTISGAIAFPDNVTQTFNPGADNAGLNVGSMAGDPATPDNGDIWYDSTAGELTARIAGANVALGAGGGGGANTALSNLAAVAINTSLISDTDNTDALGSATIGWSDLFLSSGALIDFANGNAVITHSSGILTVSTGELRVTTAGTNAASVPTLGSTSTLTNKTLTAPTIAASTMSGSHQVTGRVYSDLDALTDGATITVDWSLGNSFTVTLGGNRTIAFSNDVAGQLIKIRFLQDATGSRTLTWPAGILWPGGIAPVLTTTASKADWIGFICRTAGSAYDGVVLSQEH